MIYDGIITKPPLNYDLLEQHCIIHYNHNHDPRNGQFTSSLGGGSKISIRKRIKQNVQVRRDAEKEYAKKLIRQWIKDGETDAKKIADDVSKDAMWPKKKDMIDLVKEELDRSSKLLTEDELNKIGNRILELPDNLSDEEWDKAMVDISKELDEWKKKQR